MKKLSLTLTLICFSSAALAIAGGTGVSDGGHGVVCRSAGVESVRFLDVLEAQAANGVALSALAAPFEFSQGHFFERYEVVSAIIIERAAQALGVDHPFVRQLKREVSFAAAALSMSYSAPDAFATVQDTNDYGLTEIEIGADCSMVQLAVRTRDLAATRILLNNRYWRQLPEFEKYALVTHEALHAWFSPEASTRAARQANAYLLSTDAFRLAHRGRFRKLVETKRSQAF